MAREYKIDVIVDDHGAVETLNKVAAAEDNVASSGTKFGTTLDTVSAKQKIVVADTRGMDEAFGRFKVTTTEADYALSGMHVSASKLPSTFSEVRGGLNGLAEGIGITVEGLGMFAAAGLVVGTAITAWQVTRAISDFTGLDGAVDRTVDTVRTWVSGSEEAAAKQDTINTALRNGSGVALSYADAVVFMTDKQKEWVAAATEADNAIQRLKAPEESAREVRIWGLELEKVRSAGVMPALTADIQSHNFSHAELAQRYRVSTEAVSLLQRELTNESAALKENDAWLAGVVRRLDEQNHKIDEAKAKTEEWRLKVREIELGGDHAYSTLHQWLGELARDQKYVNELTDESMQKLFKADEAAQKFLADELAAAKAADAIFQQGARAGGIGTPNDGSQERGPAINQGITVPINGVNANATPLFKPGSVKSFEVGGPTGDGGPAMLHPGEYVVPKDGALVKSGSSSAAAAASIIYLSIDAKGATFEDDRSLDRLTDRIATRLGVRLVQRGG